MVCRGQKGLDKLLPGFCPNGVWAIWGPGRFCLCSFGGCPHLYALWTPPSRVKLSCVFGRGSWPKVPDLIWFSLKHHWADDVCVSSHITIKNIGHRFGLASLDQLQGVWGRWTFVSCAILHVREAEPAPTCTDLFWWLPTPVCSLDPHPVESSSLVCLAEDN